jgi:hypothetical protein
MGGDWALTPLLRLLRSGYMNLTPARLRIMADIAKDIAQIFFASIFVGPLLGGEVHLVVALFGFLLALGLWYSSVLLIPDTYE